MIDDVESSDAGAFVIAITEKVQALPVMPIINTFQKFGLEIGSPAALRCYTHLIISHSLAMMSCLSKEWNAIVKGWPVVNRVATGRSQLHVSIKESVNVVITELVE